MIGKEYEAQKRSVGAADGFRGNQHAKVVSDHFDHLPKEGRKTAEKIASEHNVSYGAVVRANGFAKGLDAADKIAPGKHLHIIFGAGKPHAKIK